MARVSRYNQENATNCPVTGAGTALVNGAFLARGATPADNNGMLVLASGTGANPDVFGILREAHAGTAATDTDVAGTVFTVHPVDIIVPGRIVRVEYSTAAADRIAATQAVNSTTITLTNLEDNIDAAFLYVVAGTGIGQTNYLTASAAGSATLKAAFTTSLDTTSRLIKILPRFHQSASLTSDGTKLSSQAAAGSWTVIVIDTWIVRGGDIKQMNPVTDSALTGLNGNVIRFEADIMVRNTIPYSID